MTLYSERSTNDGLMTDPSCAAAVVARIIDVLVTIASSFL